MASKSEKQELIRTLGQLAADAITGDADILERLAKCPSAQRASALLVHGIAGPHSPRTSEESLVPHPGWIHPFI